VGYPSFLRTDLASAKHDGPKAFRVDRPARLGVNDVASGQTELAQVAASWNGTAPLFVAAGLESWNITPTDAKSLADSLLTV
jgi:hypothetical protein